MRCELFKFIYLRRVLELLWPCVHLRRVSVRTSARSRTGTSRPLEPRATPRALHGGGACGAAIWCVVGRWWMEAPRARAAHESRAP